ncbi:hypothetical protein FACS189429_2750 [Bacteroidia bacterium]|nr:hypothetical protein FACS189429_2750 [Bacteroidia bacterium]GHV43736.1 hypothetical protein FACS1894180_3700 [Bacteroidia bacterium]
MNDTFRTLKTLSEGLYKDKGSKFLAFAMPVADVKTAMETLKEYRKRFYDARHVCFAYKIGAENPETRTNDDGEPSGTAGRPILGQINSNDLTNLLIVVVRYFGGVLLGTGGLIEAYKSAAADAIENGEIVEQIVENQINICFEYPRLNSVMKIVKDFELKILTPKFEISCEMQIAVRKTLAETIINKLMDIDGLKIEKVF